MKLSVVIVNFQAWNKLENCLKSLSSSLEKETLLEVIVVDNASPNDRFVEFQEKFSSVKFLRNSGNCGFAHGCNYGASIASGDTFLFLNPDTIVNDAAIVAMKFAFLTFPEIHVLSCQQTNEKGTRSKSGSSFKRFGGIWPSKSMSAKELDGLTKVDWVSGSVFMISKNDFITHAGWNEDYWMYCEDEDFCRRVSEHGGGVYLLQSPTIIHAHGGSSRIDVRTSALTKAEVIISTHLYFHNFTSGFIGFIQNIFLALFVLVKHLLLALLSLPLLFISKMRVKPLLLLHLLYYYVFVLRNHSWKSPRLRG